MALKNKKFIIELKINMENITPLHIGDGEGEILKYKEENTAYIPGTTLAGAFRSYLINNGYKYVDELFGEGSNMSNTFVYDSFANLKGTEVRPSVRINKELGVAEEKGKFDRNYIASGHKFILEMEVFSDANERNENYKRAIYSCIEGLNNGDITLGSFKSSGAGLFRINKVEEKILNLENKKDLFSYLKNDAAYNTILLEDIPKNSLESNDITFSLSGILKTPLLIKGADQMDSDEADGEQIKNKNGDYIIPGTSLKGVIRAQGERILSYHNKFELSKYIFGSHNNNDKKIASTFKIFDSIIEDKKEEIYNKIKIDKFTGGVRKGALMNEKTVMGNINIKGKLSCKKGLSIEKSAVAVLAMVFRDIAIGNLSLGSGYNIGRGRISGEKLVITKGNNTIYEYNFNNNKLIIDNLEEYFKDLNKEAN